MKAREKIWHGWLVLEVAPLSALDEAYLTVAEAAALLRVAPSTVRRWIREGDVPAYRLGQRRLRLRRGDVTALITPTNGRQGRGESMQGEQQIAIPKLTPEERERAREALERAQRHAEETRALRGGKLFSPSWEILDELREERSRQLR
jgi:excisionase family DNA binding protein